MSRNHCGVLVAFFVAFQLLVLFRFPQVIIFVAYADESADGRGLNLHRGGKGRMIHFHFVDHLWACLTVGVCVWEVVSGASWLIDMCIRLDTGFVTTRVT